MAGIAAQKQVAAAVVVLLAVAGVAIWLVGGKSADPLSPARTCNAARLKRVTGLIPDHQVKGLGFTFLLEGGRKLGLDPSRQEFADFELAPFERVVVLTTSPDNSRVLVRVRDGAACGWLAREDLLIDDNAPVASLRYGPRALAANQMAVASPLGFPRRVIPVLTGDRDGHAGQFGIGLSPGAAATDWLPGGNTGVVLHVFKTMPPRPGSGDGENLLVGVQDTETRLLGWLRAQDVTVLPDARLGPSGGAKAASGTPAAARPPTSAVLAFEPRQLDMLSSLAETACDSFEGTDGLAGVLRDIDSFWGRDVRQARPNPAALMADLLAVPRTLVPAAWNREWDDLATDLRHAKPDVKRVLKSRACAIATRLREAQRELKAVSSQKPPQIGVRLGLVPASVLQ